ncbi:MAG: DUF4391 domain-containing protein [Desulfosporosinus sp.]
MRWANKISPDTVNIGKGESVSEIEVVEVAQTVEALDKRILPLIAKAIPYSLLFILSFMGSETYAISYDGKVYTSANPPKLFGGNVDAVWDNFVRQVAGLDENDIPVAEQIKLNERREKLIKQIAALEKKAMNERQPRRKWEFAGKIRKLKTELEELSNGFDWQEASHHRNR